MAFTGDDMITRKHIDEADGSEKKAMRWLGYMQGILVAKSVFTLDDVKEHSRTRRVESSGGGE